MDYMRSIACSYHSLITRCHPLSVDAAVAAYVPTLADRPDRCRCRGPATRGCLILLPYIANERSRVAFIHCLVKLLRFSFSSFLSMFLFFSVLFCPVLSCLPSVTNILKCDIEQGLVLCTYVFN